ncbi:hypothetical protein J1779_07870 [Rahnella sp. FC061912-K]|uniref:hypothetical protein n=1 Tax=Rahnella rivi TaxID=2816249 RepID=UPI001C25C8A5|nr:hypothetical protein [Rahnella rivi]MBU9829847.1 hypothetical protein [Rahnella rivi]
MEVEFEISAVHSAIRNSFVGCSDYNQRDVVGMCIVEFLTALNFTDEEIVAALLAADGSDAETDDYIDEMVSRIS